MPINEGLWSLAWDVKLVGNKAPAGLARTESAVTPVACKAHILQALLALGQTGEVARSCRARPTAKFGA